MLAATIWVGRYWHSESFGLYEDDYFRVGPAIDLSAWEVLNAAWERITTLQANFGRPLHEGGVFSGAFFGYRLLGGLAGIYRLGWVVLLGNAILCYLLLQRLSGSQTFAATGALLLATYPCDTTPAYITSTYGAQPALTYLMGGLLSFAHGRRALGYLIATGALLTYETAFPAFLAAPLFERPWTRSHWRRLAIHGGIVMATLAAAAVVRKYGGGPRLAEISSLELVQAGVAQMLAGPGWGLWLLVIKPAEALILQLDRYPVLLSLCFIAFAALLLWLPQPKILREAPRILLTGAAVLILAYPLTLTTAASSASGRGSRVHMVAALGTAILLALVGSILLGASRRLPIRLVAALLIATGLTGAVASGLRVQQDYALAWDYQKAFWTDVLSLCPDLGEQTMVLVDYKGFRHVREARAFGWQIVVQIPLMFHYPAYWSEPPRGFFLHHDWRERAGLGQGPLEWIDLMSFTPVILDEFPNPEFILLEARDGKLHRRTGRIEAGGFVMELKPPDPNTPAYPRRRLTQHLLLGEGERPVTYIDP
ncbi:MAG: DUF998 domain-containing protein [bacterium]|nr:DUF998 domain-containing protein [bacterium]